MPGATDRRTAVVEESGSEVREQAIQRIERRRHFRIELAVSSAGLILVAVVWIISEYHNARGWPTRGFSQSSGAHDVWNVWFVYPLVVWILFVAARAWVTYGRRPISEADIQREIERGGTRP